MRKDQENPALTGGPLTQGSVATGLRQQKVSMVA